MSNDLSKSDYKMDLVRDVKGHILGSMAAAGASRVDMMSAVVLAAISLLNNDVEEADIATLGNEVLMELRDEGYLDGLVDPRRIGWEDLCYSFRIPSLPVTHGVYSEDRGIVLRLKSRAQRILNWIFDVPALLGKRSGKVRDNQWLQ